jgi:hypothetical protein
MTDHILQEVRAARAEVAADFGNDRARFWAWAREQQKAQKETKKQLPAAPAKPTVKATAKSKSPVPRKRTVRPARALA